MYRLLIPLQRMVKEGRRERAKRTRVEGGPLNLPKFVVSDVAANEVELEPQNFAGRQRGFLEAAEPSSRRDCERYSRGRRHLMLGAAWPRRASDDWAPFREQADGCGALARMLGQGAWVAFSVGAALAEVFGETASQATIRRCAYEKAASLTRASEK